MLARAVQFPLKNYEDQFSDMFLLLPPGMLPSAGFTIGVAFLTSQQTMLAVGLLTLWVGMMGFVKSGISPNVVEMAPRYLLL